MEIRLTNFSIGIALAVFASAHAPAALAVHSVEHPISERQYEQGEAELRKMLHDRPAMKALVFEGDAVWKQAARFYGGSVTGRGLSWHTSKGKTITESAATDRRTKLCTYKNDFNDLVDVPEKLWSDFYFRYFAAGYRPEMLELKRSVQRGQCDKKKYIDTQERIFYAIERDQWQFYNDDWKPRMKALRKRSQQSYWCVGVNDLVSYSRWKEMNGTGQKFSKEYDALVRSHDPVKEAD